MPCNSSDGQGSAWAIADDAEREVRKLRAKNDELTFMLCGVLRALEAAGIPLPAETMVWFEAHKKWDRSQGRP